MDCRDTLDRRYLDFTEKTREVFDRFPEIEPLRHVIFKNFLIQPQPLHVRETVKHWIAPLFHRERTRGFLQKGTVLIWVESARDIMRDTLWPVAVELCSGGARVQLVSYDGPASLPITVARFAFPSSCSVPPWAGQAWEALCAAEQHLGRRTQQRSFFYACANVQSLLVEMERVLSNIMPQVVVTASTQLMGGSALLVAARRRGIRTVLLQHGLLQPFHLPIVADTICTWGQTSSETLTRLGVDMKRVQALGSPRHDSMRSTPDGRAKRILLQSFSMREVFTLVFFSNGNDLLRNGIAPLECARWLEATAKRFRDRMNLIVRLHPNENGALYRDCAHLIITRDRPELGVLLDGSDCVSSLCSTAMHEALLYRKPVWQFYADHWSELATNWREGLATRISSENELGDMVECMLEDNVRRRCVDVNPGRVFTNHGRAAHAVADFLISQTH